MIRLVVVIFIGVVFVSLIKAVEAYFAYKLESERHFSEYLAGCEKCKNYRPANDYELEHYLDKKDDARC